MSCGTVVQLQACQDQAFVYRTQRESPFEHNKSEQARGKQLLNALYIA